MRRNFRVGVAAVFIAATAFMSGCTKDMQNDIDALKGDVASLKSAVAALEGQYDSGALITSVETVNRDGHSGWKITFSDGKSIEVMNGSDGLDGTPGTGGPKGEDGVTPMLKVGENGCWTVSYDGGATYQNITDSNGKPVNARAEKGDKGDKGDDGWSIKYSGTEKNDAGVPCVVFVQYKIVDGKEVLGDKKVTDIALDPAASIQSIVEEGPYMIFTMQDGKEFRFMTAEGMPQSVTVLTGSVNLVTGRKASFDFRVNPSTAYVDTENGVELDYVDAYTRAGYVTAPEGISYEIKEVEGKRGQFRVTVSYEEELDAEGMALFVVVNSFNAEKELVAQTTSSTPVYLTEKNAALTPDSFLGNNFTMLSTDTYHYVVALTEGYHPNNVASVKVTSLNKDLLTVTPDEDDIFLYEMSLTPGAEFEGFAAAVEFTVAITDKSGKQETKTAVATIVKRPAPMVDVHLNADISDPATRNMMWRPETNDARIVAGEELTSEMLAETYGLTSEWLEGTEVATKISVRYSPKGFSEAEAAPATAENYGFSVAYSLVGPEGELSEAPFALSLQPEKAVEGYYYITTAVAFSRNGVKVDEITFVTRVQMLFPVFNISASSPAKFVTFTGANEAEPVENVFVKYSDNKDGVIEIFGDVLDKELFANASVTVDGLAAPAYSFQSGKVMAEVSRETLSGNWGTVQEVEVYVLLTNGLRLPVGVIKEKTPANHDVTLIGERGKVKVALVANAPSSVALGQTVAGDLSKIGFTYNSTVIDLPSLLWVNFLKDGVPETEYVNLALIQAATAETVVPGEEGQPSTTLPASPEYTYKLRIAKVDYAIANVTGDKSDVNGKSFIEINNGTLTSKDGISLPNVGDGRIIKQSVTVSVTDVWGSTVNFTIPVEITYRPLNS